MAAIFHEPKLKTVVVVFNEEEIKVEIFMSCNGCEICKIISE